MKIVLNFPGPKKKSYNNLQNSPRVIIDEKKNKKQQVQNFSYKGNVQNGWKL